jgi:FixJ family two-component response regulator
MSKRLVYVVDDDPSVGRSIERLLRTTGHDVLTFSTAMQFLEVYDRSEPSCVLVDLCLPELTGLELLERLEQRQSPATVIVITGQGDIPSAVTALKHGALDFLTKPFDDTVLLGIVDDGLRRSEQRYAEQRTRAELWQRFETLTPREREVCRLVAAGNLNKQTAFELGTAEKTVKVHRARVMYKLQVTSVAELVRLVDHLPPVPVATGRMISASIDRSSDARMATA